VEKIAHYISLVMPYIGDLPLESVHSGSLQAFCDHRLKVDKVASSTVNLSLSCVRTILIRAARVWRNDDGTLWLNSAPLIEMLDGDRRKPRPISWEEQARLFKELPPHLQRMALFAVNTGVRDNNVCHLKWEWERRIPELNCSVFVIPAASFKSNRDHVVILNDVAAGVIESCRGDHSEYVFVCSDRRKGKSTGPIRRVTNTGWSDARKRAGLTKVRFHDLRHTFGQRLRDAGVSEEDRAVLMGHSTGSMPSHYATPTIARLIEMANLVQNTRDTPTLLRIVNG
jgi:integrase